MNRSKFDVKVNRKSGRAIAKNYLTVINDVIKMTEDKKINQKNAFDVNITSLQNIKDFMEQHDKLATKWIRTGEALGAGAKIYGFRVDNVHIDTYKMMSTLSRGGNVDEEIDIIPQQGQNDNDFSDDENDGK